MSQTTRLTTIINRNIFLMAATSLPLVFLTGCVGLQTVYLKKESFDKKCTITNQGLKYWQLPEELPEESQITKRSLIGCWGKPDKIVKNGDQEDWIYTQTRWMAVSVIACFRIPVFLAPCTGRATLTFKNDEFISGSDTPLCANLSVFSILPISKDIKPGQFFYSGPQSGGDLPSYGGGTYCRGKEVWMKQSEINLNVVTNDTVRRVEPCPENFGGQSTSTSKSNSTIYVAREGKVLGSACLYQVYVDDNLLGSIMCDDYYVANVLPGEHIITATSENNADKVKFVTAAGKNYFCLVQAGWGWRSARASVKLLTDAKGQKLRLP